MVPPEFDLLPYERVGLIRFSVENAEGPLDVLATQVFLETIMRSQRGVQVFELGTLDEVLDKVGAEKLDQEAVQAVGESYGVSSFFYGDIRISDVKPQIDISSLIQTMSVRAAFTISLATRLFITETGATAWTDSIMREGTLAQVRITEGMPPFFDIREQGQFYRKIISNMAFDLTRDFRPTRQRLKLK
jgi:hypothetical protein